jgi:hypothetical protein
LKASSGPYADEDNPSAPRPTHARNAASVTLWKTRGSIGSLAFPTRIVLIVVGMGAGRDYVFGLGPSQTGRGACGTVSCPMLMGKPPEVVRERVDVVGPGLVSCAVILGRELSRDEIARFYLVESAERPAAMDFEVAGRVIAWECRLEDEARWRLALEIFLVKSFRPNAASDALRDPRVRSGPRPTEQ